MTKTLYSSLSEQDKYKIMLAIQNFILEKEQIPNTQQLTTILSEIDFWDPSIRTRFLAITLLYMAFGYLRYDSFSLNEKRLYNAIAVAIYSYMVIKRFGLDSSKKQKFSFALDETLLSYITERYNTPMIQEGIRTPFSEKDVDGILSLVESGANPMATIRGFTILDRFLKYVPAGTDQEVRIFEIFLNDIIRNKEILRIFESYLNDIETNEDRFIRLSFPDILYSLKFYTEKLRQIPGSEAFGEDLKELLSKIEAFYTPFGDQPVPLTIYKSLTITEASAKALNNLNEEDSPTYVLAPAQYEQSGSNLCEGGVSASKVEHEREFMDVVGSTTPDEDLSAATAFKYTNGEQLAPFQDWGAFGAWAVNTYGTLIRKIGYLPEEIARETFPEGGSTTAAAISSASDIAPHSLPYPAPPALPATNSTGVVTNVNYVIPSLGISGETATFHDS